MPEVNRRIAAGFQGGQVLSLRMPEEELTRLRDAITGSERGIPAPGRAAGWHEAKAADGAVLLDLSQVVYLRVESDEHRVGF